MARTPNAIETETLTLSTTPQVRRYLSQLLESGLYGKNEAEAAERLLVRAIEELAEKGQLELESRRKRSERPRRNTGTG
jgi:hypothetical protein